MAEIYGGRWRNLRSLAQGGQSRVYLVTDQTGAAPGELVLKRVLNPRRHDRFRAEIEAVKRLDHPHIVKLIDHSALSDDATVTDKQFLVMPYAAHGDLSARVMLYKDNIDSVVQVAKQLAGALRAAHDAGIIHRDVKPQNILFPTAGHEVWLADFGICLIRDQDRATLTGEVVGPARFMAPELEGGGQLAVTAAADIYALGKMIYYMLSGGVILPREALHEPAYAAVFEHGGERHRHLQILLKKIICPLPQRLQSMAEIEAEIDRIERWALTARQPVSPVGIAGIAALKRTALDNQRVAAEQADARSRREEAISLARIGILGWLKGELEATAALIGEGGGLAGGVRDLPAAQDVPVLNDYRPGAAVELWVNNTTGTFHLQHILRFSFCTKMSFMRAPLAEHVDVAVLPTYAQTAIGDTPPRALAWQLLAQDGRLTAFPKQNVQLGQSRLHGLHHQREPKRVYFLHFTTDQWPAVAEPYAPELSKVLDAFIAILNSGAMQHF